MAEGLPVGVRGSDLAGEDGADGGLEEGDELGGGGGAGDVVDADGGKFEGDVCCLAHFDDGEREPRGEGFGKWEGF